MHRTLFSRTSASGSARARLVFLLVGAALLLAACTGGSAVGARGSTAPGATSSASPSAAPAATPVAPPADVVVTEADNGHTVTVQAGSTVTLVLANTYWQVQGSSDAAVLALASGPDTAAASMGTCVPGAGCGTVTTVFRALAAGRASITAARQTCGEAIQCTGTAGAFEVTIVVGG